MTRTYLCIDLKCFYASVECAARGLDPFETCLVVADPKRGDGAICLAISPKMKQLGIQNRCRVFDIPKTLSYITALPRMRLYMETSADIYEVYLKYISKDDIHVYSIDEAFLDVTNYLQLYQMTPSQLANVITQDIYKQTGITATVGIGTNLYLAKVALDISAKHSPTHMAFLDEDTYKKTLWHHQPLTDFWQVGRGIAKRLKKFGIMNMYDVAHCPEKLLYNEFGVNAEYLIDHAHGIEPTTIADIKLYQPKSNSLSSNQILFEDYSYEDASLVLKEMVEQGVLNLIEKRLVTNHIGLHIGYSKDSTKATGGSMKLSVKTNSYKQLYDQFQQLYERTTNRNHLIRSMGISFGNVVDEEQATYDLFTDMDALKKEKQLQLTVLDIKHKYGKNSVLKGMNLLEKATTVKRNSLIGGHNAE